MQLQLALTIVFYSGAYLMIFSTIYSKSSSSVAAQALPGCRDRCGNLTIPYPFGVGEGCYLEPKFNITCDDKESSIPPKAYLGTGNVNVTKISLHLAELKVLQYTAIDCYDNHGKKQLLPNDVNLSAPFFWLGDDYNFAISTTKNKFTAIGCDTSAIIEGFRGEKKYTTGCMSLCDRFEDINFESCSGMGCCQITKIPKGLNNFTITVKSFYNHTAVWSFCPCSYAFLAEDTQFQFSKTSFQDFRNITEFPMVLNWAISNLSCDEAKAISLGPSNYVCKANSKCVNSISTSSGYLCRCLPGYDGNPYHPNGCQDIDECKKYPNICIHGTCQNTPGSYKCSCRKGYTQPNNKSSCSHELITSDHESRRDIILYVVLSVSAGLIALLVSSSILYWGMKKRKMIKLRQKFFEKNGGLILQQQLANQRGSLDTTKIFTLEELKMATNNFHESRVIGEGGYGIVYKGILSNQRIVAIKKSKIGTKIQTASFINEVTLLMQLNHKNVVKFLGCCLETKVPLLVYEFISNGTLSQHIHNKSQDSSLSWELRLKIATETAEALAYLHSEVSTPIIHRDVKTANILLDDTYTAKVSDFGASRLVPLDEDQVSTFVQGTFGYLDPEYMHSSQLTDKSDVYSFGVVLAELLTSQKAVSFDAPEMDYRNLAMCFVSAMKEDCLLQILDNDLVNEGNIEVLKQVANLAKRCLRLKGDARPSMKEVAVELERLKNVNLCSEENEDLPEVSLDPNYCIDIKSESFDSTSGSV